MNSPYQLAQHGLADLKAAIHLILQNAPEDGMRNVDIGRTLGINYGHSGKHQDHIPRTMLEIMKARLEVFQNESGREGVDFIVKTASGHYHELYLQPINLEKERSVKIAKQELGTPRENLWIALVLFMKDINPVLYLIPSGKLAQPDDRIFFDNDQGERFSHLSNWEIKVFTNAIEELSKYAIDNAIKLLK